MGNYLASFFSPEAGQARRAWLDEQTNALMYYVPPELRPMLAQAYSMTPVASYEDSVRASGQMMDGNATPGQRWKAAGDMAAGVLGIVAPMAIAGRAGAPLADAVTEGLMNYSAGPRNALADFAQAEDGGIRLWHGSPHDFDRFDMSKIGTGEGAQAYSHGLYFASLRKLGEWYRDNLSSSQISINGSNVPRGDVWYDLAGVVKSAVPSLRQSQADQISRNILEDVEHFGTIDKALKKITFPGGQFGEAYRAASDWLKQKEAAISKGRLYEVNVDANPEDFLDWDAPLSKQPQKVRDALEPRINALREAGAVMPPDPMGDALWRAAHPQGGFDKTDFSRSIPEQATERLREAGIPGVRYLDAGSRGAGDGSRNYVVFDDSLITILKKYLVPGAAVSGAIAASPNDGRARMQYDGQGNALYMLPPRG